MTDQPLAPFHTPALFAHLPAGALSEGAAVAWVLYAVFAFWAAYTFVIIYHWLKYSHDSRLALPAIGAHLAVSFALMAYALSGTIL